MKEGQIDRRKFFQVAMVAGVGACAFLAGGCGDPGEEEQWVDMFKGIEVEDSSRPTVLEVTRASFSDVKWEGEGFGEGISGEKITRINDIEGDWVFCVQRAGENYFAMPIGMSADQFKLKKGDRLKWYLRQTA